MQTPYATSAVRRNTTLEKLKLSHNVAIKIYMQFFSMFSHILKVRKRVLNITWLQSRRRQRPWPRRPSPAPPHWCHLQKCHQLPAGRRKDKKKWKEKRENVFTNLSCKHCSHISRREFASDPQNSTLGWWIGDTCIPEQKNIKASECTWKMAALTLMKATEARVM